MLNKSHLIVTGSERNQLRLEVQKQRRQQRLILDDPHSPHSITKRRSDSIIPGIRQMNRRIQLNHPLLIVYSKISGGFAENF